MSRRIILSFTKTKQDLEINKKQKMYKKASNSQLALNRPINLKPSLQSRDHFKDPSKDPDPSKPFNLILKLRAPLDFYRMNKLFLALKLTGAPFPTLKQVSEHFQTQELTIFFMFENKNCIGKWQISSVFVNKHVRQSLVFTIQHCTGTLFLHQDPPTLEYTEKYFEQAFYIVLDYIKMWKKRLKMTDQQTVEMSCVEYSTTNGNNINNNEVVDFTFYLNQDLEVMFRFVG